MAFGAPSATTSQQAKPPEKGVFPLDHFGECTEEKEAYIECVRGSTTGEAQHVVSEACHHEARAYLACRMKKGLMARQELDGLGLPSDKPPRDDRGGNRDNPETRS